LAQQPFGAALARDIHRAADHADDVAGRVANPYRPVEHVDVMAGRMPQPVAGGDDAPFIVAAQPLEDEALGVIGMDPLEPPVEMCPDRFLAVAQHLADRAGGGDDAGSDVALVDDTADRLGADAKALLARTQPLLGE